jgi:protein TonB
MTRLIPPLVPDDARRAPLGAVDLKARARVHLRRGLVASTSLHLLLLALFLRASGDGREAVLRTFRKPTLLVREILLERPVPPPESRDAKSLAPRDFDPSGRIEPVIQVPDVNPGPISSPLVDSGPPIDGDGAGPENTYLAPPGEGEDPPEEGVRVVDEYPLPIEAPKPEYPSWAREAGITGRVVLHVLVGEDGRVRRVTVKEDVHGLGAVAAEAVARWVFRPARVAGRAVAVWVAVPVWFRL